MRKTSGKCCENIGLNVSPVDLKLSYKNWMELNRGYPDRGYLEMERPGDLRIRNHGLWYNDIHLTYPMLEFLYQDNIHPDGDIKVDHIVYHYRCKHHDKKTGKCTINDIKPTMCISFPDYGHCKYKGCSCSCDKRWEHKQAQKKIRESKKTQRLSSLTEDVIETIERIKE
jgi:Fe-S-cluster containining protein